MEAVFAVPRTSAGRPTYGPQLHTSPKHQSTERLNLLRSVQTHAPQTHKYTKPTRTLNPNSHQTHKHTYMCSLTREQTVTREETVAGQETMVT